MSRKTIIDQRGQATVEAAVAVYFAVVLLLGVVIFSLEIVGQELCYSLAFNGARARLVGGSVQKVVEVPRNQKLFFWKNPELGVTIAGDAVIVSAKGPALDNPLSATVTMAAQPRLGGDNELR